MHSHNRMPTYRMLGRKYTLTQEELDRVPASVLTEAAACARPDQQIDLKDWHASNPLTFQASGSGSILAMHCYMSCCSLQ